MAWREYLEALVPAFLLRADVPKPDQSRPVAMQEFGTSGTENFGGTIRREDYNPDFDNWEKAVATYDKMRRTDAMVRAILQVIKLPLRGATWQCNPASSDPADHEIADFCNHALFDDDAIEDGWDRVLSHILTQLEYGVAVLETVWMVDERGKYRFKRLAPRLAKTLREWHVDRQGKLVAIVQYASVPHGPSISITSGKLTTTSVATTGGLRPFYGSGASYQYLVIPASYAAIFTLDKEGDNYTGTSLLRNVYRNYWFKDQAYHVMGVGLDRWGVGIPIAQLEEGNTLTTGDKETLREILQAVRSNEKAYMVMPEHVKFGIEPNGSGQGTQGHFGISWIEHHDAQMARSILASFLTMGRDPRGTLGFGSRLTDLFVSSLNGIASGIATDIKQQLVKRLCDVNFDMSRRQYPDPVCLDLEQVDLMGLIDIFAKLQGSVLTPQDDDEEVIRKMLGLPQLDPHRSREAKEAQSKPAGEASAVPPSGAARVAAGVEKVAPPLQEAGVPIAPGAVVPDVSVTGELP